MLRKTVFRGKRQAIVGKVHSPSVITFHQNELVTLGAVGVNPCREFQMSDVFHVQSIVVVHHHMIFGTVKAQRIVSPRTNLDNPVDGEVLRVVLEVVPTARHDVAHVCAGDVNEVLVAAL